MTSLKPKGERAFTLIEIVVVLAILGTLIALAIPRYLGARRDAFYAEADNVLDELKSLAWGYYLERSTWTGIDSANMSSTFGFVEPPDSVGCWDYTLVQPGDDNDIRFRATGDNDPVKCTPVNGVTVTLILYSNGSSTRTLAYP